MVEDTMTDAMLIEHLVKKSIPGSQFICVEDQPGFEKALLEYQPEIILSDYSMPHFDGMTALKIALEAAPDTPFIIVTGSINEETAVECMKAGAWDYVLKDHLTRLDSAIARAFEQQKVYLERRMAIKALHESEERYRNLINFAPITIGVISDNKVVYLNPAGQKLIGAESIYEVMGKPVETFLAPDHRSETQERIQMLYDGENFEYPREEELLRLDGKPVSVEIKAAPLTYNNKKSLQVIVTDITERRHAERDKERLREDLYREKEYLNSLIENASTPIITWKPDLTVTVCNRAFELLSGLRRHETVGLHVFEALGSTFDKSAYHHIKDTQKGKEWSNLELTITGRSGEKRTVIWNSANIYDSKGNGIATIVQGTDITERKKAEENSLYISYHDHLTDLYNRRYFEIMMTELTDQSNLPITIIMSDINGLKLINDSFGHEAGDELLIKASRVIRRACRDKDIVARIGGDEFGIILLKTDEDGAEKIVRRIKEEAASNELDNKLLSISFGYATAYTPDKKLDEVMMEAENYMYRHKMYESASMHNKTIDVIINALYEKSEREMLHSKRVSKICARIAEELELSQDDVNRIRTSGLVHDIGKIGISEKILSKPGKLSDEERAKMQKHSEAGWRILSSAKEFSDLASHILYHHERWDGKGYPEGRAGEDIPIEARIIAVADAYDAMTSKRPYREPMALKDVIAELQKCADTQFDRHIVEVFLTKVLPGENNSFE
jgi:diguanylate cyclase (GGDEF)-like protein/PAS domain S-box-containing protein